MRDRLKRLAGGLVLSCLFVVPSIPAPAQNLSIGVQAETSSTDPHFSIVNPSVSATRHMFDTLAHPDERQALHPGLALGWAPVGDTEWEFRLRPGVKFHDGSAFTAADVAYSLLRARDLPNTLSGFDVMTKQITDIKVVDDLTVRIRSARPFPLMAEHLSAVAIMSRSAEGLTTTEMNAGKGINGTGPFRFVSWVKADALRLARNDAYWGKVADWTAVTIRPIPDDGARVAALVSGTVDAIDLVPPVNVPALRANPGIALAQTVSNRIIYFNVNVLPAANPGVTDAAGAPINPNPLADRRVRLAISKAINRDALTARVLEGMAIPAAQLLPDGYPGTSPALRPEAFDPDGARALLAEAGFKDGFNLVITVPRDRNANDVKSTEAAAQMLSRIGLRVTVEALPFSITQPRNAKAEFAMMMRGWGTETGENSMALRSILGTRDTSRGWGMVNGGRYSNTSLDTMLETALATLEPAKREAMVAQATELGIRDVGIVPLHYQMAIWGLRKGLSYRARSDSYTFAFDMHPVPR